MRAGLKHGVDNFKFEVLCECSKETRYEEEKRYIQLENSLAPLGYNVLKGGPGGGFIGKSHSEATVEKMRLATTKIMNELTPSEKAVRYSKIVQKKKELGFKMSDEAKKKISEKLTGKTLSEIQKTKISESLRKHHSFHEKSIATRLKISEAAKKRVAEGKVAKFTDEMKAQHSQIMTQVRGIKVDKFDKDDTFVESYDSLQVAAKENNTSSKSIRKVLKGEIAKAGGFIWKYHVESPKLEPEAEENLHTL